jgi:hypothetical protein
MIPPTNNFVPSNLNQRNRFGIPRLEADGCAGWDIKTVPVGFDTVELKVRIRLYEMVV